MAPNKTSKPQLEISRGNMPRIGENCFPEIFIKNIGDIPSRELWFSCRLTRGNQVLWDSSSKPLVALSPGEFTKIKLYSPNGCPDSIRITMPDGVDWHWKSSDQGLISEAYHYLTEAYHYLKKLDFTEEFIPLIAWIVGAVLAMLLIIFNLVI